jgi:protein phosphatase slingshot
MSRITEQLYIGNYANAINKKWLDEHHITHIVNATSDIPNYYPNDYKYLQLKLEDSPQQSIYQVLEPSYKFIYNAMGNGGTVLIHCHMGKSRSVSIVIYFLMKLNGWTYLQALNYIRQRRSIANPNSGFARQLVSVSPEAAKVFG